MKGQDGGVEGWGRGHGSRETSLVRSLAHLMTFLLPAGVEGPSEDSPEADLPSGPLQWLLELFLIGICRFFLTGTGHNNPFSGKAGVHP